MRRKILACSLLITLMSLVCGCGEPSLPKEVLQSSLAISKDGSVSEIIVESFAEDYYSVSELSDTLSKWIASYNTQKGGQASVHLGQVETVAGSDGGKAVRAVVDYDSIEDYNALEEYELLVGAADLIASDRLAEEIPKQFLGREVVFTNAPFLIYPAKKVEWVSGSYSIRDDGSVNLSQIAEDEIVAIMLAK